jgi:NAD(P)-dependent dehydrogenase (short-subunit alcohol dehydrogenase family)
MSSIEAADVFSVQGLVAVITGGGTGKSCFVNFNFETIQDSPDFFLGIGLMMAKALEANGAKVYIIGRRPGILETAAREAVIFPSHRIK